MTIGKSIRAARASAKTYNDIFDKNDNVTIHVWKDGEVSLKTNTKRTDSFIVLDKKQKIDMIKQLRNSK